MHTFIFNVNFGIFMYLLSYLFIYLFFTLAGSVHYETISFITYLCSSLTVEWIVTMSRALKCTYTFCVQAVFSQHYPTVKCMQGQHILH